MFSDAILNVWNHPGDNIAEMRELCISWATLLLPLAEQDPLLQLRSYGIEVLNSGQRADIVRRFNDDVVHRRVPRSLEPILARTALVYWGDFRAFVYTNNWKRITRWWPVEASIALC